jgi:hypothetical protein
MDERHYVQIALRYSVLIGLFLSAHRPTDREWVHSNAPTKAIVRDQRVPNLLPNKSVNSVRYGKALQLSIVTYLVLPLWGVVVQCKEGVLTDSSLGKALPFSY